MTRILASLAAALLAALAVAHIPALAEPRAELPAVGMPLKLTPTLRHARHTERPAIGRPSHRLAQPIAHRAPHPMARPAVTARRAVPTLAAAESRPVDISTMPRGEDEPATARNQDSRGSDSRGSDSRGLDLRNLDLRNPETI